MTADPGGKEEFHHLTLIKSLISLYMLLYGDGLFLKPL